MQSTVENIGDNKVRVNVALEEAELEAELEAAFKRISKEARIPGFRPGKAPRKVLEKHIGSELARKEALRTAMPDYYAKAVREHDVDVIAYPEFEVTDGDVEGPVKFEATVEVRPVIPAPAYKNLKITVPSPDATEEDINNQLDRMRSAFAELKTVERAAKTNDNVLIDLHTKRANEELEGLSSDDFMYEIGSEGVVPELDAKLNGAKAGEILEFSAAVPGVSDDENDKLQFRVLVKEVKEKILPDLTDEWASDASEFETLAELRADIEKRVRDVKLAQAQFSFRENILNELTKQVALEIPDALLDLDMRRYLNELMYRLQAQGATLAQYMEATGRNEETLTAELRLQAVESVKADLVLRAVAADLAISATESDLDEEINKIAEQVKQKPEQVRHQLEHADELAGLRSDIAKTKALEWLLENVEVVDETGKAVDRSVLTAKADEEGSE
jgi:trigger factor